MILAVLANLAVGLVFAWAARERLRADGPFSPPVFPMVLTHVVLVTAPVTLYFYAVHRDWSWLYLVDPAPVPMLAILPLVVSHALCVVGGWYLGAVLIRIDKQRALVWTAAAVSTAFLVAVGLGLPRLLTATTYAGWRRGVTGGLMSAELGWSLLVAIGATLGALAYLLVELIHDSRRVRLR